MVPRKLRPAGGAGMTGLGAFTGLLKAVDRVSLGNPYDE